MNKIIITESSRSLRTLGREALRGKWRIAVVATLVYMVAMLLPMLILDAIFGGYSGISGVYSILITGPFTLGYSIFCMALFRNKDPEVAQVFYGFERFGRALGLYIMMSIFIFLWTLLFIVPGIIAAIRYSQVFLIMADNPNMGIMDCIDESKKLMAGNKGKYFCMMLSFIGWLILCGIPVSIFSGVTSDALYYGDMSMVFFSLMVYILSFGYLWVMPYMNTTAIGFYEILVGNLRPGVIETTGEVVAPPPQELKSTETYREETATEVKTVEAPQVENETVSETVSIEPQEETPEEKQ